MDRTGARARRGIAVTALTVALALAAGTARADSPPASPSGALTDAELTAARDHDVTLTLTDGTRSSGVLLLADRDALVLAGDDDALRTVARARVATLTRDGARDRYVAFQLAALPTVAVDLTAGGFYAFASGSLFFPAVITPPMFGFTVGVGVNFTLSPGWRLDLFAMATTFQQGGSYYTGSDWPIALGVGIGFRYEAKNGFTIGFKIPAIGAALTYAGQSPGVRDGGNDVGNFYLSALVSTPLFFVGYRL